MPGRMRYVEDTLHPGHSHAVFTSSEDDLRWSLYTGTTPFVRETDRWSSFCAEIMTMIVTQVALHRARHDHGMANEDDDMEALEDHGGGEQSFVEEADEISAIIARVVSSGGQDAAAVYERYKCIVSMFYRSRYHAQLTPALLVACIAVI